MFLLIRVACLYFVMFGQPEGFFDGLIHAIVHLCCNQTAELRHAICCLVFFCAVKRFVQQPPTQSWANLLIRWEASNTTGSAVVCLWGLDKSSNPNDVMWHPELELLLLHPVATRILWRHGFVVWVFSVGKLMGAGSWKRCLFQRLPLTSGSVASLLLQWSFFSLGVKNCVPSQFNFNLQWEKHQAQAWYSCSHTKTKSSGFFSSCCIWERILFSSCLNKSIYPFYCHLTQSYISKHCKCLTISV